MHIRLTSDDGTELLARRTGAGPAVVLVHGSAGGLDSWDPVLPFLAGEFELWVYARRGYPPSGPGRPGKSFADDVADLAAVLTAAGGSAHVVGASYGGTVALHAAASGLAAIRTLAVFEPPLFAAGPELLPVLDRYRSLLAAGDLAAATRLFAAEVARIPAPLLDVLPAEEPDAGEVAGCLSDLEAMAADDGDLRRWSAVAVPVLLVQGERTWEPVPATVEALAAALPSAAREVLAGQAHFATHTAPDLFAGVLGRFLRDRH